MLGIKLLHVRMHRRPPHDGPQPGDPTSRISIRPYSLYPDSEPTATPPGPKSRRTTKGGGKGRSPVKLERHVVQYHGDDSDASSFVSDTSDEDDGPAPSLRVHEIEEVLDVIWKEEGGTDQGKKEADKEIAQVIVGLTPLSVRMARMKRKARKRVAAAAHSSSSSSARPPLVSQGSSSEGLVHGPLPPFAPAPPFLPAHLLPAIPAPPFIPMPMSMPMPMPVPTPETAPPPGSSAAAAAPTPMTAKVPAPPSADPSSSLSDPQSPRSEASSQAAEQQTSAVPQSDRQPHTPDGGPRSTLR